MTSQVARIIRYVEGGALLNAMSEAKLVAILDPDQNILRINRLLFDRLDRREQHRVLWTEQPEIEVTTTSDFKFAAE